MALTHVIAEISSGDTIVVPNEEYVIEWKTEVTYPTISPNRYTRPLTPDSIRDKTLAYVNTARNAMGMDTLEDLPKGKLGNAQQCVIARALPDVQGVGTHIVFKNKETAAVVAQTWAAPVHFAGDKSQAVVTLPHVLRWFVNCFDNGHYPDLVVN